MNNVSFQGKGDKTILTKMKNLFRPKKLPKEQAILEQTKGLVYGMTRPQAEVKETIMRETMLGNSDFVRGANEALSKNAAKDAYKNV